MIAIMSGVLVGEMMQLAVRERALAAGETLFRVGDPILSLFIVAAGEVRLLRALPDGAPITLQRAGPGAILAEASLFAARYHCDATATEPSHLSVVPRRRIEAALVDKPAFSRAWAHHLAQEVQHARAQAEILSLKKVAERFQAWLVLNGNRMPQKGRWRRIASEIGVTPEALYRELARLR